LTVPTDALPPYYLQNFERALAWIAERYDDLLAPDERAFLETFERVPQRSRALLVRMLMRKGTTFRASRLVYEEIGAPLEAAAPLAAVGWTDCEPALTIDELFALSTRPELARIFAADSRGKAARKADWLEALRPAYPGARPLCDWDPETTDSIVRVLIDALVDRLRLMFFGNLHQDWSEFVLADLGVYSYEAVPFPPEARAFRRRADIDAYLALHACRAALDTLAPGMTVRPLFEAASEVAIDNDWLETRRAKLLFRLGQHAERHADWDTALDVYSRCAWPGARHRRMRVLERVERFHEALSLAETARAAPESEEESQRVERMLARLNRRVGKRTANEKSIFASAPIVRELIVLARPEVPCAVEYAVRDHLHEDDAPVFYVENGLINSLFGLLCWDAVFAPLPGAFFHPFQRGPADLHAPDFPARRAASFARSLGQLNDGTYRNTILDHLERKAGIQSPFVFWSMLTPELVAHALDCLAPAHLLACFTRLLGDIRSNRSGLPDLVRFWPQTRRYEFVEVKGPGDRLQDNQIRWLRYCSAHGIPVRVLDVRWADEADAGTAPETAVEPVST
jgi:hypothetical protein